MIAIAAWGSFFAALASAIVALFSYWGERARRLRADLVAEVVWAPAQTTQPINQADIDLRLENRGEGPAWDMELDIYPSVSPDEATDALSVEHSPLPPRLESGDEVTVRVTLVLPGARHTARLTWYDGSMRSRRQRYQVISARL